ncbi:exo-alpha-sialidase [Sinomonas sp. JGH33]|uniref:Exo-alpha-sialidase n=1 Tax=Sinomonas terricola TaxID=3110330 RepID=A0ABU5TBM8_9MICC|nr:exo-alpha-sialidase [Sinomonas sp. JGH33]MEA5457099.1 exo-alpha-sialidase [Sinomonas sp. JGH33]
MDTPAYLLAIGTKKGLWLARSTDRRSWDVSQPHFLMQEIPAIGIDTRGGRTRLLVGVRSEHFGPTVVHSDDLGASWNEPDRASIAFDEGDGAAVERIWQILPDAEGRPGVVWAGAQPISVWKSTDGGETFELNRALWEHPDKGEWGAGYGGAAAHSIVPDSRDPGLVHIAMSTGGVYRSRDGGASWERASKGISAYFLPDPEPEIGQCVHKISADPDGRLYAQNHRGVFRSDNQGEQWVSIADGLPADFGFVMLTHPRRGGTAWVIPLVSDFERIAPGGHLAVHRTDDAGETWRAFDGGLPAVDFNTVLRDAACVDAGEPVGVYFGTRGGSVFASSDEGESFVAVATGLPDVLCVRAVVLDGWADPSAVAGAAERTTAG